MHFNATADRDLKSPFLNACYEPVIIFLSASQLLPGG